MARSIVWLGSGGAALALVVAGVIGLRGSPPPAKPTAPSAQAAAVAQPNFADTAPSTPKPSFDIVTVDPRGQAVIAGRSAPGDRVRVLDSGKPIGEVTADKRGEWVLVPDAPIAPGNRQLGLEARAPDGGSVRQSNDVVALSVVPPDTVGNKASTLAVLLPGERDKPARLLQQPGNERQSAELALDTVEYDAQNRLILSGHAEPGARVAVYADDAAIGTAAADPHGKWSLAAQHPVAAHAELRLDQLAGDGSVLRRIAAPFELPAALPTAVPGTYVVQRGNSLWLIARHVYGQGPRYTAIYGANREQIRDPNRIYPGQLFKMPKS